jgi:hypothetical protein
MIGGDVHISVSASVPSAFATVSFTWRVGCVNSAPPANLSLLA